MLKLLRSNFTRILQSKTFWICAALYLVFGFLVIMSKTSLLIFGAFFLLYIPTLDLGFNGSPFAGIIILIFVSVIIGANFKNNTIRNKISIGYSKSKIYLSNVLAFSICAVALHLIQYLLYLAYVKYFDVPASNIARDILWGTLNNILATILYVSIYTAMITNMRNTSSTIICGVLLSGFAVIISYYIMFRYVIIREEDIWLYFLTLFPTGLETVITIDLPSLYNITPQIYPLLITLIMIATVNAIGVKLFKKSNLN